MKKIVLSIFILIFIFSCNKTFAQEKTMSGADYCSLKKSRLSFQKSADFSADTVHTFDVLH